MLLRTKNKQNKIMKILQTSSLIVIVSVFVYLLFEHINNRMYKLFDEFDRRGNDFLDETERRIRRLINDTISLLNNQTVEQIDVIIERNRKHIPLKNPYGATTCTDWFGCHQGYCWAGCAGGLPSITGPEWCYTTKSKGKTPCSNDSDCNGCWRCTSSCTI